MRLLGAREHPRPSGPSLSIVAQLLRLVLAAPLIGDLRERAAQHGVEGTGVHLHVS